MPASLNAAPANLCSGLVGRLGLRRRRSPAKDPHPHPARDTPANRGVGESVLDDEVEGGVVDLVEAESGSTEFGPDDLGVRVAEHVLGGLLS